MYVIYKSTKIYYERKGLTKYPIIFLHGWGGSSDSFRAFAKAGDILIDFPPFGKSSEPKCVFCLEDYVNIVLKIIKKEDLKKVSIVAHSFGGRVALELSSKYNIVERQVLTGCAGLKPKFSLKKYLAVKKYKKIKKKAPFSKQLEKFGSTDYKSLSPCMKKTFVNIVNNHQNRVLKNINCDTLLVWGKNDRETPLYMAKILKKYIRESELILYNGGHFCYLENSYAFSKILDSFLRKELWNFLLQIISICT